MLKELDRLENLGVLERIDEPTEWVSRLVIVKKPSGSLQLGLDPKPLNSVLKRSHYQIPALEDILPQLANAKVFSVADVMNGYWHVPLDRESQKLTTFGIPFGRYCWRQKRYGISVAPELFQERLQEAIEYCGRLHEDGCSTLRERTRSLPLTVDRAVHCKRNVNQLPLATTTQSKSDLIRSNTRSYTTLAQSNTILVQ